MPMKKTLKQLFAEEKCVLAPEVYDCASTMAVERCGYKALVLSGAEVSMAMKGVPDLGILRLSKALTVTSRASVESSPPDSPITASWHPVCSRRFLRPMA